jgi:energy-coupling factor transporter ATP-binding protein EcfA2
MASSKNPLKIQVAKHDQWETQQPKIGEGIVPPTPCRILVTGPSGSGKTQLAVDMLTRIYAGSWERIYVFSPSVHLDSVWNVVKDHVNKVMGVPDTEKCFYDSWDEEALDEILKTQKAVVAHQKKEKAGKQIYGICVIVDDFADSPQVMASRQGGNALNTLLVRGRHMMISSFILTQKLRLAGSILRVNAQALVVFRLRNRLELDAIIEELSAVYDKKVLMEMYQLATAEPYSFWFINLAASRIEDMFWLRFEQRMIPSGAPNALQE